MLWRKGIAIMNHPDATKLYGHWVHAHEEDAQGLTVYRPGKHPLPPSRGRQSLDLRPDGTITESGPGPADRTQRTSGRWTLNGTVLTITDDTGHPRRSLDIVEADPERLVVRR
jgi:hypothetical protein